MKKLILLCAAVFITACGGGGGTSTPSVAGKWFGPAISNLFPSGFTETLDIVQNGTSLSGTIAVSRGASGIVTGTIDGNTISLVMSPDNCTGTINWSGVLTTAVSSGGGAPAPAINLNYSGVYTCNGTVYNEVGSGLLIKTLPSN